MEEVKTLAKYYQDEDWCPLPVEQRTQGMVTRSKTKPKVVLRAVSTNIPDESPPRKQKVSAKRTTPTKVVVQKSQMAAPTKFIAPAKVVVPKGKPMSDYELQILKNIEERKKLFEMLQLGDAKKELAEVLGEPASKRKAIEEESADESGSSLKRVKVVAKKKGRPKTAQKQQKIKKSEIVPLRRSSRERRAVTIFMIEHPAESPRSSIDSSPTYEPSSFRLRHQRGKTRLNTTEESIVDGTLKVATTLSSTYADQERLEDSTKFIEDIIPFLGSEEPEGSVKMPAELDDFVEMMKKFVVTEDGVTSISAKRISALSWHSNTSKLILATGDLCGTIAFWNVDYEGGTHRTTAHDVHTSSVTALTFDRFNNSQMFSTSKDGSVRLLDFTTGIFDEVLSIPLTSSDAYPIYHLQMNSNLLVSRANGEVSIVDVRMDPTGKHESFKCFDGPIPTLSGHPVNENHFLACSQNGDASIFDIRQIRQISLDSDYAVPVTTLPICSSRLSGAVFSPLTGDLVLSTGLDVVQVYDVREETPKCVKTLNFSTARRVNLFTHGVWHPQREDVFVLGGPDEVKRVEMYGVHRDGVLHEFEGETMSRRPCISAFHPTVPVLATGSVTNGYIHLFRPAKVQLVPDIN